MEEVAGSIPASSTTQDSTEGPVTDWSLGGFVAGEGYFSVTRKQPPHRDGDPRLRFVFGIQVAQRDLPLLERLKDTLGCGSIAHRAPGRPGHQPSVTFSVSSMRSHRAHVIPFMDRYLPPGHKRHQFGLWADAMDAYERAHPSRWGRGPSPCRIAGCEKPVRGRGLCRTHYYRETGY